MLEILAAIIAELFGQKKPQAQPRRRVRPSTPSEAPPARRNAAPSMQSPGPVAQNPQQTIEDMMRHFFGQEEEEESETEAVETPLPPPARIRPATANVIQEPQAAGEKSVSPSRKMASLIETETTATRVIPKYAAKLRSNPAAAREAFVYSEIFGPPLADRY